MRARVSQLFGRRVWGGIQAAAAFVTILSILISAIVYLCEWPTRKREAVFSAWGILTHMEGKRVDGGRSEALQQLLDSNVSLAGINLSGAILENVDLSSARLIDGLFQDVKLINCDFGQCDMTYANLANAHVKHSDFTAVQMAYTQLHGAVVADCMLDDVVLHGAEGDENTSFNGATMRRSDMSNAKFPGANFDNAILIDSIILSSNIESATFQRAELTGSRLIGIQGANAQFQNIGQAQNVAFVHGCMLAEARFDRSVFLRASFDHADLSGASFFGANLTGTEFSDSNLSGADFSSCNMTKVTFVRCNIEGMVLSENSGITEESFQNCTGSPIVHRRE